MSEIGIESFFMNDLRLLLIIAGVIVIAIIYFSGRRSGTAKSGDMSGPVVSSTHSGQTPLNPSSKNSLPRHQVLPPYRDLDAEYMADEDDYILDAEADFESATNDDPGQGEYTFDDCDDIRTPGSVLPDDQVFVSSEDLYQPSQQLPPGVDPMIICVNVMSPHGSTFNAEKVKASLEDTALVYGDMQIYHYYEYATPDKRGNKHRVFSVSNAEEPGSFNRARLSSYKTRGLSLFLQIPSPIDSVLAFERMYQLAKYFAGRLGGVVCDDRHNKLTPQAMAHIKDQISAYKLKLLASTRQSVH